MPVDKARGACEYGTEDEVGKLSDGGALGNCAVDQILKEFDQNACYRTVGVGSQKSGKVRKIKLDKRRHDRDRKLQILEHRSGCCKHSHAGDKPDPCGCVGS